MCEKDQKITDLVKQVALLERKNMRLKCQHNVEIQEMLARENGVKASLNVELDRNDELDIEVDYLIADKESMTVGAQKVASLTKEVNEFASRILLLECYLENENICCACGSKDFQDRECDGCKQYHLDRHNDAQLDRRRGK